MIAAPSRLLVLEPAEHGHGWEWLLHLASYAARCDPAPGLVFAVAPAVAGPLRHELSRGRPAATEIVALSQREAALCCHRILAVSGMARWWVMRRHLRRAGAAQGLFLELDHLSLPLALGLPLGSGRSVSGILFRPSVHYGGTSSGAAERLRDLRKDLFYRRMLRHRALRRVHSLDDAFPAFARTHYLHGDKVKALPDPVHPPVRPDAADRALAGRAPSGRVLLVLFGVLTARKGVLALLRALARLNGAIAAQVAVIVAGKVDAAIRAEVDGAAAVLARRQPFLWLHIEPRHLSAAEIAALVDRADVVLAPYQRFVGSSGVLMWAAGRGRPVIAQDYGLVGRLVRDFGLGLAVDTADPVALAHAIAEVVRGGAGRLADPERMAAFAGSRTADAFAAAILDPVLPGNAFRRDAVRRSSGPVQAVTE